jgi:cell division protein FtsW (lipid II flippase)
LRYLNLDKYSQFQGLQNRLHGLAAVFLFTYSLALTLSPAVRSHSWNIDYIWTHWIGYLIWLVGFTLLNRFLDNAIPDRDQILLPGVSLLVGWGLLTIFRIDSYFGLRQTAWLVFCFIILWLILRTTRIVDDLRRYKYLWLTLGIILVALTVFIGVYPGGFGPQLWLGYAGLFFQPSELLKLLLLIFLSAYLADRLKVTFSFSQLIAPALVLFGAAMVILLVQRDLGTSALFIILFSVTIFLATGKRRHLLISFLIIFSATILGYFLFDVIRLRVEAWINPWLDPSGRSYQIVQSLMAVAAGGFSGRGPGLGSPRVVPVAQSDFIFSAIAEEIGMVGTIGLVCLLILITFRGFRIALRAKTRYYRILAAGITTFLAVQSILIIGGNLRVLPLTGVTLPFISYGGSSLFVSMICAGLLLHISDTSGEDPALLETPSPYFIIFGLILAGFILVLIANGWWSIVRSSDLLSRTDNPRRGINERYSPRGSILDNQGLPINFTEGQVGSFTRTYRYPPLSPVFGFNSFTYGQSGLESSLDDYLRGERGVPASSLWWNHLLYGQPPAGLDIRTSIDMDLQQKSDQLLSGKKGALVLINAETGEVLAMSSHPNVDPNQVDSMWTGWMQDPQSPLINRATQSLYPLGTTLSPFLLSLHSREINSINLPPKLEQIIDGLDQTCSYPPEGTLTWGAAVSAGCPGAFTTLATASSEGELKTMAGAYGLIELPDFILPQAAALPVSSFSDPVSLVFGDNQMKGSPLQLALASSVFTNGGRIPAPLLAVGFQSPRGWVYFSRPNSSALNLPGADQIAAMLSSDSFPGWETTGKSSSSQGDFSWFIGGTAPGWKGTPLALALVLEGELPQSARSIGRNILGYATNQ